MTTIGQRIEAARKKSRLSIVALGRTIGVSEASIRGYETNRVSPPIDKLRAIAAATEQPIGYFLDETDEEDLKSALERTQQQVAEIQRRLDTGLAAPAEEQLVSPQARPHKRHTGMHELLDLHEAGQLNDRVGIVLSKAEEAGVRTYGRSGPPVDTLEKAIQEILMWRQWEISDALERTKQMGGRPKQAKDAE